LVFTAADSNVHAIDTSTGKDLWTFGVGNDISSAPSIAVVDGEEYILQIVSGTGSKLIAFKIGGDKTQIPAPAAAVAATIKAPQNPDDLFVLNPDKEKSFFGNLVAGFTAANNGFNFNGWSKGDVTVTVPTGWEFNLNLFNPTALPHSAMIVTPDVLKKGSGFTEALQGASTPNPTIGFTGDQVQHWVDPYGFIRLSVAGEYAVICAVPGHAAAGMYFNLSVKTDVTTVSITTPTGTKTAKTRG